MYTKRNARLQCMWQITIQHCEYMQQCHNSLRIATNEMTGRKGGGRKETVSNNFLNEAIRSVLYGGRRLVYYNKFVFLKKRTCKGDELALTWTQGSSAVREVLVQLLGRLST